MKVQPCHSCTVGKQEGYFSSQKLVWRVLDGFQQKWAPSKELTP
jgi:hypothetical protein